MQKKISSSRTFKFTLKRPEKAHLLLRNYTGNVFNSLSKKVTFLGSTQLALEIGSESEEWLTSDISL